MCLCYYEISISQVRRTGSDHFEARAFFRSDGCESIRMISAGVCEPVAARKKLALSRSYYPSLVKKKLSKNDFLLSIQGGFDNAVAP